MNEWKLITVGILLLFISASCSTLEDSRSSSPEVSDRFEDGNYFQIEPMAVSDSTIRSIQLHPTQHSDDPPVLELGSSQTLTLRFERIAKESMQYRMRIEHFRPDWTSSRISSELFLDGFPELIIGSGIVSRNTRTSYRQYSVEFPQAGFRILRSGNYLLRVIEDGTGDHVFSIPFFVSEDEGSIQADVEVRTALSRQLQTTHRPVADYQLPGFVGQPQFDLSFVFTQNRFWGRHREADELDFSAPGQVRFELSNEYSFPGNSDFRRLDLQDITRQQRGVVEAFPGEVPPRVVLQDDVAEVNNSPFDTSIFPGTFGRPDMGLNAEYANVVFPFDAATSIGSTAAIHLLGDFNFWLPSATNRMSFDEESGRWRAELLIKEGVYRYKYVLVENGKINDLYFDNFFSNRTQQYHAFVYMYDSREFYHRLLKVQDFYSQ
jgi:hypothetical protein